MSFYSRLGKRGLDLALAVVGLMLLSLPMLAIGLWLRLVEGPPVSFRQWRVGRKGVRFQIFKFRTMECAMTHRECVTVEGDPSITRTGLWLRRTKLDELPQLFNVLKGEMSFVGPRPDVPGYMDQLQGDGVRLLALRPGITGPASLAFRHEEALLATAADPKAFNDEVIFPEKVRLNLQYLEELSLRKDLFYLWRTLVPSGNPGPTCRRAAIPSLRPPSTAVRNGVLPRSLLRHEP